MKERKGWNTDTLTAKNIFFSSFFIIVMIILLSFVMCFRSIGRFYVNNVYICTSITNIVYMSDRQQFIIDCTSLIPVIGTLVLIKIANEQMVTMVAAYVLCGELLGVLISRILRLYYIDVAFVWLGGIMLWLWYWFGVQPSYMGW
mgnify:FL=1